jgi:hypothetical protein
MPELSHTSRAAVTKQNYSVQQSRIHPVQQIAASYDSYCCDLRKSPSRPAVDVEVGPKPLLLLLVVDRVLAQASAVFTQAQLRGAGFLADGVVPLSGLRAHEVNDLSFSLRLCHSSYPLCGRRTLLAMPQSARPACFPRASHKLGRAAYARQVQR